ncbi:response regulator transcription factor [Haloarchaeobius amylolyticus]|uniref:response regulator transcription factor n=1 Tax=Haloarchaeobius amylolyticus TaxID=1198296 RepID=UPI0022722A87|nr:response regulator [Haloarchaeobius amylolyticus]
MDGEIVDGEIVAADDDEQIRRLVAVTLGDEFAVQTLETGQAAWDYLETRSDSPPRLVLLDVMMPELDGFSLLERIRNEEAFADVPVLMLTSRSREEDVLRALDAGADGYIAKPFDRRALVDQVRDLLEASA